MDNEEIKRLLNNIEVRQQSQFDKLDTIRGECNFIAEKITEVWRLAKASEVKEGKKWSWLGEILLKRRNKKRWEYLNQFPALYKKEKRNG